MAYKYLGDEFGLEIPNGRVRIQTLTLSTNAGGLNTIFTFSPALDTSGAVFLQVCGHNKTNPDEAYSASFTGGYYRDVGGADFLGGGTGLTGDVRETLSPNATVRLTQSGNTVLLQIDSNTTDTMEWKVLLTHIENL